MPFTSFDPASLTTNGGTAFTLSNSNLTATANNATNVINVKTVDTYMTGKYYWEIKKPGGVGSGFSQAGLCNASAANNAQTGGTFFLGDGRVQAAGSIVVTGMNTWNATRQVCSIAVDLGAMLFWTTVGQDLWNNNASADPASGIGGIAMGGAGGLVLPMKAFLASGGNGAEAVIATANFGGSPFGGSGAGFGKGLPSGFTAGLPTGSSGTSNFFFAAG